MTRSQQAALVVIGSLALAMAACTDGKPEAGAPISAPDEARMPADAPPPDVPEADLKALADGNNAFAIDLYKKLAEKTDGNIVVSPYSISSALAMTYAGARGQTAEEMAKVLRFAPPPERLHPSFEVAGRHLTAAAGSGTLDIANTLWVQDGLALAKPFAELTRRHYGAGLEPVDFGNPEVATRRINRWVAKRTRDKIPELINPGSLSPQTQLVLTNAIYLNCRWATPFPVAQTKTGGFESAPGKTLQVLMMRLENTQFRAASTPEFNLLELPYEGGRLAMLILLPTRQGGLRGVEEKLSARLSAELQPRFVTEVMIPRFAARSAFTLNESLRELGMRSAFSRGADFSGMLPGGGTSVGSLIHEGLVEVNEQGTTAAAATAVLMLSSLPTEFRFRADRPFLFLITEPASGAIIFIGRCMNPV